MKTFLTYSAIIEAFTGLGLLIIPSQVVLILMQTELNAPLEIILSMVAGAAIFSLALICWFSRLQTNSPIAVKGMLFYNVAVASVLLYGAWGPGFKGFALWLVIIFHFIQTVICVFFIIKRKNAH